MVVSQLSPSPTGFSILLSCPSLAGTWEPSIRFWQLVSNQVYLVGQRNIQFFVAKVTLLNKRRRFLYCDLKWRLFTVQTISHPLIANIIKQTIPTMRWERSRKIQPSFDSDCCQRINTNFELLYQIPVRYQAPEGPE
ncbi:hypothetical protein CDAR_572001 [Caerostris darwini]|uniref:Uncharacterized protein n=1 Tax=Caerostris darwini TaxID=1538125 RepID=A0AAV4MWN7_9ARAC|nr:hypothetical protein CDAR_572001 [Caerostris darwini]